ncbi:HGGxSTG domain-containing protein [Asticcacaulis benevestitus]|uniref:HGGxSTG domain-containing protein n=1 Tax=Asticcacaulis benevestitus TaxID=347481 RepID=UPI0009DD2DFA
MSQVTRLWEAKRCGAKTRRSGCPCQAPAIRDKARCRMHGGKSPGAPRGPANGRYAHGLFTKEAVAAQAETRRLLRTCKKLLEEI